MNVKTVLELTTSLGCFIDVLIFNGQVILRCEEKDNCETINITKHDLSKDDIDALITGLLLAQSSIEINFNPTKITVNNERNILL